VNAMKQITVLVPNQVGVAASITAALAEKGVNIESFDAEGMEDRGIIVLTVDKYDDALRALRDHGFQAITQDVLLVQIEDKPGALAVVAMRLRDAGLDLRSMHIVRRDGRTTLASLVASNPAKAAEVLKDLLAT